MASKFPFDLEIGFSCLVFMEACYDFPFSLIFGPSFWVADVCLDVCLLYMNII